MTDRQQGPKWEGLVGQKEKHTFLCKDIIPFMIYLSSRVAVT